MRDRGIAGLYQGIGATLVRDVGFSIIYFPLFATLNKLGPRKAIGSADAAFYVSFMAGLSAGLVSSLTVTPIDVIKTRLQATTKAGEPAAYSGIVDCIT